MGGMVCARESARSKSKEGVRGATAALAGTDADGDETVLLDDSDRADSLLCRSLCCRPARKLFRKKLVNGGSELLDSAAGEDVDDEDDDDGRRVADAAAGIAAADVL